MLEFHDMDPFPKNRWKTFSGLFPPQKNHELRAAELFRYHDNHGQLHVPVRILLSEPLEVIADFFRRVTLAHSTESPVYRRKDSRWVSELDYTLLNIRAAGTGPGTGNFLTAAFFLTTLGTRGLVLSPMTEGHERLSHLSSHIKLRSDIVHPVALERGVEPEEQLALFCEAAHALNFALGYELHTTVATDATVVTRRPELFFWQTEGAFDPDAEHQARLREHRGSTGLTVRHVDNDPGLASFAFRTQTSTDPPGSGKLNTETLNYWSGIFDYWRDRCNFDFLVLRGLGSSREQSSLTQPGVDGLAHAIRTARKNTVKRSTGIMAEGDSRDLESLGTLGVDIVLEQQDHGARADRQWFLNMLAMDTALNEINLGRKLKFTVPIHIDPGDTDNHSIRERARIKRFVAKFFSVGPSRRPVMETMGAHEGAWGFQTSLVHKLALNWPQNPQEMHAVRTLERIARQTRDLVKDCKRVHVHLDHHLAWWVLKCRKGLVIALVSVENNDMIHPADIHIDYSPWLGTRTDAAVLEYDFSGPRGLLQLASDGMTLHVPSLPYRGYRLYTIV